MVARGGGRLAFASSVASATPGSFQPVYNASKAFVESFAQALADEVKDTGVTVTSFLPGPTDTEFFDRAGMADDTRIGVMKKDDPAQVAEQAYEAIVTGERKALTGSLKAKAQGLAGKVLREGLKAAAHRRMADPGSADAADTEGAGRRAPGRRPVRARPALLPLPRVPRATDADRAAGGLLRDGPARLGHLDLTGRHQTPGGPASRFHQRPPAVVVTLVGRARGVGGADRGGRRTLVQQVDDDLLQPPVPAMIPVPVPVPIPA